MSKIGQLGSVARLFIKDKKIIKKAEGGNPEAVMGEVASGDVGKAKNLIKDLNENDHDYFSTVLTELLDLFIKK